MRKTIALLFMVNVVGVSLYGAVEERIIGVLEKTAKSGACAQITDVLKETYYVAKSSQAERLCKPLIGKKVVVAGVVEERNGDPSYYFKLRNARAYSAEQKEVEEKIKLKEETSVPLPPVKKKDATQKAPQPKAKKE